MSKWTSTPGMVDVWLWWRETPDDGEPVIRYIDDHGEVEHWDENLGSDWQPVSEFGGQWWSVPIEEPEEGGEK